MICLKKETIMMMTMKWREERMMRRKRKLAKEETRAKEKVEETPEIRGRWAQAYTMKTYVFTFQCFGSETGMIFST